MINKSGQYWYQLLLSVVIVMVLLLGGSKSVQAHMPGANLLYPSCDPGVDPLFDAGKITPTDDGYNFTQSCIGHNGTKGKITIDNFALKIRFDANEGSIATASTAAGVGVTGGAVIGATTGGAGFFGAVAGGTIAGAGVAIAGAEEGTVERWIEIGNDKWIVATLFEVRREGDQACVYAKPLGLFNFTVDKDFELSEHVRDDGARNNCYFLPPPRSALKRPTWSPLIAPVCTYFCDTFDHDKNPATPDQRACHSKTKNPFMGAVVQCVTETLDNLFYIKHETENKTVFEIVQERFRGLIRALMVLYVTIFAYQFMIGAKQKIDRAGFIWVALKIGLVTYFAGYEGMMRIKPMLHDLSQELSLMVMESGFGIEEGYEEAVAAVTIAREEVDKANEELKQSRMLLVHNLNLMSEAKHKVEQRQRCRNSVISADTRLAFCEVDVKCIDEIQKNLTQTSCNQKTKENSSVTVRDSIKDDNQVILSDSAIKSLNLTEYVDQSIEVADTLYQQRKIDYENQTDQLKISAKLSDYDASAANLREAISYEASFGYDYCDYRQTFYGDEPKSNLKIFYHPDGTTRERDMTHMRLWDTLDCKFMKYIGVGDYTQDSDAPQLLLLAIALFFTNALGIPIFILTVAFFVFFVLVIVRVAHIYIMSFVGLVILIYISPLVIPMVLFEFTKTAYKTWFKNLFAYVLQPVIMFVFVAFLFATFDQVIYEDNHYFYPLDYGNENSTVPAEQEKIRLRNSIQKIPHPDYPYDMDKAICPDPDTMGCILQIVSDKYSRTVDFGLGKDFTFLSAKISTAQGVTLFLSLLKLMGLVLIFHSVLTTVEDMSRKLTDALGGGSAILSGVPVTSAVASMNIGGKAAKAVAGTIVYATAKGAKTGMMVKRALLDPKEEKPVKKYGSLGAAAGKQKPAKVHQYSAKKDNAKEDNAKGVSIFTRDVNGERKELDKQKERALFLFEYDKNERISEATSPAVIAEKKAEYLDDFTRRVSNDEKHPNRLEEAMSIYDESCIRAGSGSTWEKKNSIMETLLDQRLERDLRHLDDRGPNLMDDERDAMKEEILENHKMLKEDVRDLRYMERNADYYCFTEKRKAEESYNNSRKQLEDILHYQSVGGARILKEYNDRFEKEYKNDAEMRKAFKEYKKRN